MDKKEKNKIDFEIASLIIALFLSVLLFVIVIVENPKGKKEDAEAYTNNIQLYSISNLSGTTWYIENYTANAGYGQFNINYNYGSELEGYTISCTSLNIGYYWNFAPEPTLTPNNNSFCGDIATYDNYGSSCYIIINNGTDVTNSSLINWLQNNGTQILDEELYNISYNLQNVLIIGERPTEISNLEEINIEFQNFNNYELPQNIMVENANYNWEQETGILTIYNATGNVTITIRAEYISGNYSFIELIDSIVLIPLNTFFNLFNFELFGVNIYALLTATLTLFIIIKVLLKIFK